MRHWILMMMLAGLLAGWTGGNTLHALPTGGGLSLLGTPYPPDKPEEWTSQDCSRADQSAWPPHNLNDTVKPGYCVVPVEVDPAPGGGCRVLTTTPGLIFISGQTKWVIWRLRLADAATYRFAGNGIVVRKNSSNFKDEPTDTTRRFFAVSRLTSENRVYAYDIKVERRSDGVACTVYGPLIVNRD